MKTLLTDRTLRGLKPAPAGKRAVIWDTAVPGLSVRVTDKGAASFNVMRRVKGQADPVRRMLGVAWTVPFPASVALRYPLATAREDARAMILDMSRGVDPKAKDAAARIEESARHANSFAAVAEAFIVKHVRGLKTGHEVEATIRRELIPKWGLRPITAITRRDVVEIIGGVADSGRKYAAHKLFNYVSKLFSWAIVGIFMGWKRRPVPASRRTSLRAKKSRASASCPMTKSARFGRLRKVSAFLRRHSCAYCF